jgi:hypothetical protein
MTDPDPTKTRRPGGPEPSPPPPPSGDPWEEWIGGGHSPRAANGLPRGFPDLTPLIALVEALRRVVPAELQAQVNALIRELLLTIRALIDWYLERLDGAERGPQIEDIPIE